MNQIAKQESQELTLIESSIRDHQNQVGDIFQENANSNTFIRLDRKVTTKEGYSRWECSQYNMLARTWESHYDITDDSLKSYYSLLVHPFSEIVDEAEYIINGGDPLKSKYFPKENDIASDETALATQDKAFVMNMLEQQTDLSIRCKAVEKAISCYIQQQKESLNAYRRNMEAVVSKLDEQVTNIKKVITVIELYAGVSEEILTISEGERASGSDPVCIRQRILFMDEEMMINAFEGGADYTDKGRFIEWMKNPSNRDIILPESKCIVVMKPRRFDKRYAHDEFQNKLMNQWNHHSFILFRNGECVWMIESDNFCIYDKVFPSGRQMEKLYKGHEEEVKSKFYRGDKTYNQTKIEDIAFRSTSMMMWCQGIADRTDMFSPTDSEISFSKNKGIRFINDDDENLIGEGRLEWPDFLKEVNKGIRYGSRVVFMGVPYGSDMGDFYRDYNEFNAPETPNRGLYGVEYASDNKTLVFKYLPGDKIFSRDHWRGNWEYSERKQRVSWIFRDWSVIDFDNIDLETLDSYLNDRSQRKHYQKMIPVLMETREQLIKEMRAEDAFIQMMLQDHRNRRDFQGDREDELKSLYPQVIKWWKHKTIQKRALSIDDAKAYRMIRSKVMRVMVDGESIEK